MFTDGITICKKSKITIWPIILALNELQKEKRFCKDQMIIAGNFKSFFLKSLSDEIYFLIFKEFQLLMKRQNSKHFYYE
jgi:hypothetical protein